MKSALALMLILGLLTVSSHAEKPLRIEVTLKVPLVLKGNNLTDPDTVTGENGVACSVYNYVGHDVTLQPGHKIELRAAYWNGEASWSEDIERYSISCYGGGVQSRLSNYPSLSEESFEALREGMKNVFSVDVLKQ